MSKITLGKTCLEFTGRIVEGDDSCIFEYITERIRFTDIKTKDDYRHYAFEIEIANKDGKIEFSPAATLANAQMWTCGDIAYYEGKAREWQRHIQQALRSQIELETQ